MGALNFLVLVITLFSSLVCCDINVTVIVHYPDSSLPLSSSSIYLRGDSCGLSWDAGVLMTHSDDDKWTTTISVPSDGSSSTNVELKASL